MMCYDKYPTLETLYKLLRDAAKAGSSPVIGFLMANGLFPGGERFRKSQEDMYQYNRGVHLLLVSVLLTLWLGMFAFELLHGLCKKNSLCPCMHRTDLPCSQVSSVADLTDDILRRPEPPEGCTQLWACIRDAFPGALHDEEQYERMLSNVFIMFVAAYETTSVAITCTLLAIALEQYSQDALVKVRGLEHAMLSHNCVACGRHMEQATTMYEKQFQI